MQSKPRARAGFLTNLALQEPQQRYKETQMSQTCPSAKRFTLPFCPALPNFGGALDSSFYTRSCIRRALPPPPHCPHFSSKPASVFPACYSWSLLRGSKEGWKNTGAVVTGSLTALLLVFFALLRSVLRSANVEVLPCPVKICQ